MRALLIRCYPARWRARYGDEFLAVLEERPLGPFDVADILLGALDARLRSRAHGAARQHARGFTMSLRIGGIAAILGTALLGLAWFMGSGLLVNVDDGITQATFLFGMAVLLVALTGLSAFQGRADPALSWTAFGLAAVGVTSIIAAFVLASLTGDSLWYVFMGGVFACLGGCLLFAIVTYRTAVLSRAGALLVGVGCVMFILLGMTVQPLMFVGLVTLALGWVVLGVAAIRLDSPRVDARPA